jgi:hypothetical protein
MLWGKAGRAVTRLPGDRITWDRVEPWTKPFIIFAGSVEASLRTLLGSSKSWADK